MTTSHALRTRLALGFALCVALPTSVGLAVPSLCPSRVALAQEATAETLSNPETQGEPDELQQLVEQTAAEYDEAVAARDAVQAQISETQTRIEELEARLPALRDAAADAMRLSYKLRQGSLGLVDLIVSAGDFSSLISTLQYLTSVQSHSENQIYELAAAVSELDAQRQELARAQDEAEERVQQTASALEQAQAARQEAQRRAEEQADAQRAQEEAALAAQQAAAAEQAQAQRAVIAEAQAAATTAPASSSETPAASAASDAAGAQEAASSDGATDADAAVGWDADRAAFVSSWGARIDVYLAGSALAGQGATFAAAAWDYGVDPRFSPAIAFVESTLGAQCFRPHNAWGWGSASWDSWEEAIYAHTSGLARIYGAGLTYDAACTYCPSNADFWYAAVLAQMESI